MNYVGCRDFLDGPVSTTSPVGQDWGGMLFRLVGEQPKRFRAVVAANTALRTPIFSPRSGRRRP